MRLHAEAPSGLFLQATFVLFESASGFALFDVKGIDEIGQAADKVQASVRCGRRMQAAAGAPPGRPLPRPPSQRDQDLARTHVLPPG
jgi:hypothetical protein